MKNLVCLLSLLLSIVPVTRAEPSKAECKALADEIGELTGELGLTPETTGRELLNRVDAWVEGKDPQMIEEMAGRIETATRGVADCAASRHSAKVQEVRRLSTRLQTAVLPWLRGSGASEPCQSLVNQAVRKQSTDPDGAIADLEQSVRECKDGTWLREAQRNLVTLYYGRGDVSRRDHERARELTRQALALGEGLSDDDRQALAAVLAKPTIEAGRALMERGEFEAARAHWQGYIESFGTPDFDVLFRVEEVAQGAWMLHELKDARYQLALACVELGDLSCVGDAVERYKDEPQSVRELTERAFARAAEASGPDRDAIYDFAFDMLTAWNEIDPGSYQIKRLLQSSLVERPREERLALLRRLDQCWIPMHVAEALRQEGEDYLDEAEIAADCGGGGGEAQQLLDEVYIQAAFDKVDRLDIHAQTIREKRALLADVEQRLLPKIDDSARAAELKAKIAEQRERIRQQIEQTEKLMGDRYSGCTELLALVQWNMAREEPFDREVAEFKRICCEFLVDNASGWDGWMRSQPEDVKLADEEIENKNKLMRRYCGS